MILFLDMYLYHVVVKTMYGMVSLYGPVDRQDINVQLSPMETLNRHGIYVQLSPRETLNRHGIYV